MAYIVLLLLLDLKKTHFCRLIIRRDLICGNLFNTSALYSLFVGLLSWPAVLSPQHTSKSSLQYCFTRGILVCFRVLLVSLSLRLMPGPTIISPQHTDTCVCSLVPSALLLSWPQYCLFSRSIILACFMVSSADSTERSTA